MGSSRAIFRRIAAAYRTTHGHAIALTAAVLLTTLPVLPAGAQTRPKAAAGHAPQALTAAEAAQRLPLDAAIRTGRLPNGFTYFIRANGRPAGRASMRLAVQAGSIDETDQQRGYAHFLEHMGFNGGRHFKPGELVKYLESIGSSFGADLNAYTSYDETVYMLEIPTDKAGLLDRGLDAMWDFAGGMSLQQDEVDRERGVVIEEWRQRRGVGARIREQQAPVMYGDSKYTRRDPIGTVPSLEKASAATLRAFYEQWYRADRMALIVVGDVDAPALEAKLKTVFGSLKTAATPAPARVYPIPPHREPRYGIVADAEATQSSITILEKAPRPRQDRVGDYRRGLVEDLAFQMLNARFAELAQRPSAPYLTANAGKSALGRGTLASVLMAGVPEGGLQTGLSALATEAARASRHGFTEAELERARKRLLASYEQMFNERKTSESPGLASELVRHFLEGESVPGIERETEMARRFVPGITLAETGAVIKTLLSGANRVVLTVSPKKDGLAVPAQADLARTLTDASTRPVEPWKEAGAGAALLASLPAPGTVTATRQVPELGATVLTLSNGVTVWLKPTDFKADQVVFSAVAKGGLSLASPADYASADLSTNVVDLAGVGGHSAVDLEKLLAGKTAGASAYINANTHGVAGAAAPKDLETAFQLIYLQLTAPNFTDEGFQLLMTRLEAGLKNRAQNPGAVFGDALQEVNTLGHYSSKPLTLADLPSLKLPVMRQYYTARFANAADLTFIFSGAFTVDGITPFLTRYLASLPSTGKATGQVVDTHIGFPADVRRVTVKKGKEPKAQTVMSFFADTGLDEMEMHRLRAACSVLEMRLTEILREQMGGTYGVNVGYTDNLPVKGYGLVQISFGSAPDRVDQLVNAVLAELKRLKAEGPAADDVQKVREIEKRGLETSVKTNGYWVNSIQTVLTLGWDPVSITRRAARTESLSTANVGAAFGNYFPEQRYTVVTLLPGE